MSLLQRLAPQPPTFSLAAPRCAGCGELIHLLRITPERAGEAHYHAACIDRVARAAGVRVVTRARVA
jgi:hypothetical protein